MTSAIDVGCVAAPIVSASVRKPIREPGFHAAAVRSDGDRGAGEADDEDAALSVEVAHLAEDGQRDGGREHRRGEHPREHRLGRVQILRDVAERDDEDRDREGRGEHAR